MNQAPYQPTFVIVRYVWPMIREAESNFPWLECYLKLSLRHNILTLSASEYQFLTVRQLILSLLSRFRLLWVNITEISQPFQRSISIKLISLQLLFPNQHEIGAALFFFMWIFICSSHLLLAFKEHLPRLISLHMVCNSSSLNETGLYDFSKPIFILTVFPTICPSVLQLFTFSRWFRTLNVFHKMVLKSFYLLIWYPLSCSVYKVS